MKDYIFESYEMAKNHCKKFGGTLSQSNGQFYVKRDREILKDNTIIKDDPPCEDEIIGEWSNWYERPKAMYWVRHAVMVGWDREAKQDKFGKWLARDRKISWFKITELCCWCVSGMTSCQISDRDFLSKIIKNICLEVYRPRSNRIITKHSFEISEISRDFHCWSCSNSSLDESHLPIIHRVCNGLVCSQCGSCLCGRPDYKKLA